MQLLRRSQTLSGWHRQTLGRAVAAAAAAARPAARRPCHPRLPLGGGGSSSSTGIRKRQQRLLTTGAGRRDELLRGVDAEHKDAVACIVEQAERAVDSWTVVYTDFVTPPVAADALAVLSRIADAAAVPWGGYPQAERVRIAVGREEQLAAAAADPATALQDGVAALSIKGNFLFDPASHRDFLGATLGTGVERSKVGDVIVQGDGESGAQILVAPSLVEHLESTLTQVRTVPVEARQAPLLTIFECAGVASSDPWQVRTVPVETRQIPLPDLRVPPHRVEELSTVEASLRLDAVASAGFRMSRSKMADLCKAGDVRLNWRGGSKPSTDVKAGDVISCAGKGRVEVVEVGMTKKGKYSLRLRRLL